MIRVPRDVGCGWEVAREEVGVSQKQKVVYFKHFCVGVCVCDNNTIFDFGGLGLGLGSRFLNCL